MKKISDDIREGEDFISKSKEIYQHLIASSRHPNIKDGDLIIAKFDDILVDNKYCEAIGVYKIETKDNFIESYFSVNNDVCLKIKHGITPSEIDKAALIIYTSDSPSILVIDKSRSDTQYWIDDFLHIRPTRDEYFNTQNMMAVCKNYVVKQLSSEFDISKADQAEFWNRSTQYFKDNESFDLNTFTEEVISQPEVIKSFNSFKNSYQQDHDIEIADEFDISSSAVKKQTRAFKSVIKLDKNFHIYVHGNNQYIKRGYDEATGMHYYQLFFKEEL